LRLSWQLPFWVPYWTLCQLRPPVAHLKLVIVTINRVFTPALRLKTLLTSSHKIETGHIQIYYSETWKSPTYWSVRQSEEIYSSSAALCRFGYTVQRKPSQRSLADRKRQRPNIAKASIARRTVTTMGDPPVCGLQHSTTAFRKCPSPPRPGVVPQTDRKFLNKTDFFSSLSVGNPVLRYS